jgi:hypothetical protein
LEAKRMRKAPHSVYSPDLTPSNFYLFDDKKKSGVDACVSAEMNVFQRLGPF